MDNWRSDYWRPYGQWSSEGAIRNSTWRTPHNQSYSFLRNCYDHDRASYLHHPYSHATDYRQQQTQTVPISNITPHADSLLSSNLTHRDNYRDKQSVRNRSGFVDFDDSRPDPLILTCEVSAQKVDISWKPPTLQKNIRYLLECQDKETGRRWTFDQSWTQTQRELRTTPGSTYCIRLECENTRNNCVLASAYKEIRAVFSYDEMTLMYNKCVEFVGISMHPFDILYRCKPKSYWDEIHHFRGGIMEKYIKDENGQPANRINGMISGLFFSARVQPDGTLPMQSPFGNVRMMVAAPTLLDPSIYNYYFADFYCNYITHYVTIVICKKGSETDNYCYTRLRKLNAEDNPFLKVIPPHHPYYVPTFYVNRGVWVEIYFTEDIPLNWGRFDSIIATGAGTSKIGGLPNNKHCEKCNLYPIRPTTKVGDELTDEDEIDGVADVTVAEDALNSTFHVLMNEDKTELNDHWEDLVEVICGLVDSVCEAEGEEKEKDPMTRSDENVISAITRMDEELGNCKDIAVLKAAKLLKDFAEEFRRDRGRIERSLTHISMISRILSVCRTIPPNILNP